jgi:nucleotide-binding universal stress UspA family protein
MGNGRNTGIGRLLVPLDGTGLSEAVLPVVADLALRGRAAVTLLHVLEASAPRTVHGEPHLADVASAERYLADVARRAFGEGVAVDWHVHGPGTGDVAASLADHAEELSQDMVVMRAHGEARLRDWLKGNMAQQVVRRRTVPVLLLASPRETGVAYPFKRLLVPLDDHEDHEAVVPLVRTLARLCGAEVHLATVVTPDAITGGLLPGTTREVLDLRHEDAAGRLAALAGRFADRGVAAKVHVVRGDPAKGIARVAARVGADLLAMGTHGRAGTAAFWEGSLAQRLIRQVPASFLLVPVGRDLTVPP